MSPLAKSGSGINTFLMKYQINEDFAHCHLRGFQLSQNTAFHRIVKLLRQSSIKRKPPGSESPASLTITQQESRLGHHVSFESFHRLP